MNRNSLIEWHVKIVNISNKIDVLRVFRVAVDRKLWDIGRNDLFEGGIES